MRQPVSSGLRRGPCPSPVFPLPSSASPGMLSSAPSEPAASRSASARHAGRQSHLRLRQFIGNLRQNAFFVAQMRLWTKVLNEGNERRNNEACLSFCLFLFLSFRRFGYNIIYVSLSSHCNLLHIFLSCFFFVSFSLVCFLLNLTFL